MTDQRAPTTSTNLQQMAVIDVGTTSIRMAVAQITETGHVHTLETLQQAVNLGRDTFTTGTISKATMEDCVAVFTKFREKLGEFEFSDTHQIRVVATSAVREARNRLAFVDRIYVATGLVIHILDEAEVSRVTYTGVHPFLHVNSGAKKSKTIVIEVGGGSTEVLILRGKDVLFSHTYRLGSLRLRKRIEAYRTPQAKARELMESQIRHTVAEVREQISTQPLEVIALGGDMRFATRQLMPQWNATAVAELSTSFLEEFTDHILEMDNDEIVRRYHLSFPEAETVGPALLVYVLLAQEFDLESLLVSNANLRDGLLQEMAAEDAWTDELRDQIIESAVDLGKKFDFDEPHSRHVADLSRQLFRQLKAEHQLDSTHELLLYVAALLYEIGGYISNRSLHKHSMYLIRNSELFGLGRHQVLLISLIARYHRRASPQQQHDTYGTLPRSERVVVSKLAALLRLAIAFDDSRSQRIQEIDCHFAKKRLVISVPNVEDISMEQIAVRQSATLFEEIFGKKVELRRAR